MKRGCFKFMNDYSEIFKALICGLSWYTTNCEKYGKKIIDVIVGKYRKSDFKFSPLPLTDIVRAKHFDNLFQ